MSDPWGKSGLTILGGQEGENAKSIAVLAVNAFNIASPTTSQGRHPIHPEIRASLLTSFEVTSIQYFGVSGVPHDFLLVPRNTPQGGGTFDPFAVVVMSEMADGSRTVQAYEFPPPLFDANSTPVPSISAPSQSTSETSTLGDDLEATLESLRISDEPGILPLPSSLWVGNLAINDGDIVKIEQEGYEAMSHSNQFQPRAVGRGGVAWVDYSGGDQSSDVRWTGVSSHSTVMQHLTRPIISYTIS